MYTCLADVHSILVRGEGGAEEGQQLGQPVPVVHVGLETIHVRGVHGNKGGGIPDPTT